MFQLTNKIHRLVAIGYFFILTGFLGSAWLVWDVMAQSKIVGVSLILWLLFPYLAIALILPAHKQIIRHAYTSALASIVVTLFGLLVLFYMFYDRQEATGVLPAFWLPVFQDILIFMLVPMSKWFRRKLGK